MNEELNQSDRTLDPLGLRELPLLQPPADGWAEIEAELGADRRRSRRNSRAAMLATAATALLAMLWTLGGPERPLEPGSGDLATVEPPPASDDQEQTLEQLIGMSQSLEKRLRGLRSGTGSIPASSAVYVAELEDLVAQVDNQISVSPDSINLWGQRVNLLLDLTQIYQHRWEREYGRIASL